MEAMREAVSFPLCLCQEPLGKGWRLAMRWGVRMGACLIVATLGVGEATMRELWQGWGRELAAVPRSIPALSGNACAWLATFTNNLRI
jgi:hypothetical protein